MNDVKTPKSPDLTARLAGHLTEAHGWLKFRPTLTLALGAVALYSIGLGRADLTSAEAANALGDGSRLVGWLVRAAQAFGARNEFWARFPIVLIGAAGVVLMYRLALELTGRRRTALVATAAFGLFVPWIRAVRTADFVAPLVTCLLLAGYGYIKRWHAVVGLGLVLGFLLAVTSLGPESPFSGSTLTDRGWFHRNRAVITQAIGPSGSAVTLGARGREVEYYFPVPMRQPTADLDLRISGPVFVFRPESLTPKEQALLPSLHFDQLIGPVAVYRAR